MIKLMMIIRATKINIVIIMVMILKKNSKKKTIMNKEAFSITMELRYSLISSVIIILTL